MRKRIGRCEMGMRWGGGEEIGDGKRGKKGWVKDLKRGGGGENGKRGKERNVRLGLREEKGEEKKCGVLPRGEMRGRVYENWKRFFY